MNLVCNSVIPSSREVASGIVNLGNTCYMNAVLQALAHAPELCLAIEFESHMKECPVYEGNTERRIIKRLEHLGKGGEDNSMKSKYSSVCDSDENSDKHANRSYLNTHQVDESNEWRKISSSTNTKNGRLVEKSLLIARRSQTVGKLSKYSPQCMKQTSSMVLGEGLDYDSDDEFCSLCEIEKHLLRVHNLGRENGVSSPSTMREYHTDASFHHSPIGDGNNNRCSNSFVVEPNVFVKGFINQVAPWFKLGVQEDSHEFLRLLIDAMQKSCIRALGTKMKKKSDFHSKSEAIINTYRIDPLSKNTIASNNKPGSNFNIHDDNNTDQNHTDLSLSGNKVKEKNEEENSYAFRLFRGTVESVVKCSTCFARSSKIDPIEDVGLEVTMPQLSTNTIETIGDSGFSCLPTSNVLGDVTSSLERFTSIERLDGYSCEQCGKIGAATKRSHLASMPPILTLHLKRFRYGISMKGSSRVNNDTGVTGATKDRRRDLNMTNCCVSSRRRGSDLSSLHRLNRDIGSSSSDREEMDITLGIDLLGGSSGPGKIKGHVRFEQVFDMTPYLTEEARKKMQNVFCRLFAVVVHTGRNNHSGHYICYVRNISKNEWWKMDDARVTRVGKDEVFASEAYMLFYRVVEHPVAVDLRNKEKKLIQAAEKELLRLEENRKMEEIKKKENNQKLNDMKTMMVCRNNSMKIKNNNNCSITTRIGLQEVNCIKEKNYICNTSNATINRMKRKRQEPKIKSGEEWATIMMNFPKSFVHFLRRAEDFISENINFKPEYMKVITKEAENSGRIGEGPSIGVSFDDIQGDKEVYRRALWHLIGKLLTMCSSTINDGLRTELLSKKFKECDIQNYLDEMLIDDKCVFEYDNLQLISNVHSNINSSSTSPLIISLENQN